jgi:hypothetical protein
VTHEDSTVERVQAVKVQVEVSGIKWDTDGELLALPHTIVMEVEVQEDPGLTRWTRTAREGRAIEDAVAGKLAADYGSGHKGFSWRSVPEHRVAT